MKNVIVIILILIACAGGFLAGMKYQQTRQSSKANFQVMREMGQGAPGIQRPQGADMMVGGKIIDKDEASMTVKLPDGSSKIVLISENTEINKATEGSVDDLATGEQVMVVGQTNSDGSVTAQNIQLNPELRGIPIRNLRDAHFRGVPGRTPRKCALRCPFQSLIKGYLKKAVFG